MPPRTDIYTKVVFTTIAILLAVSALFPEREMRKVYAQSEQSWFYWEPGTTVIRTVDGLGKVQGKIAIDLRNGDVWGFPTGAGVPYPVVTTSHEPPWSKAIYLGRFDLTSARR